MVFCLTCDEDNVIRQLPLSLTSLLFGPMICLECSHMTSTNQSQSDVKFVTENGVVAVVVVVAAGTASVYCFDVDTDTHQSRDLVSPYKYFSSNRSIHCPISLSQKYNHFSPFHLFLFQDGQRIPIRQNYHEECEALVNKQANMKLYHSYVYMSMVRMEDKKHFV